MRQKIIDYIKKKYKSAPEYLWKKYPDYAVFRHEDNNKWFALQAPVSKDKLGLEGNEIVEVIDVKVDDILSGYADQAGWHFAGISYEQAALGHGYP